MLYASSLYWMGLQRTRNAFFAFFDLLFCYGAVIALTDDIANQVKGVIAIVVRGCYDRICRVCNGRASFLAAKLNVKRLLLRVE